MDPNGMSKELIRKMNCLQDVFAKASVSLPSIDFPRIVVIGSQSSEKSSVLESFVGKNFLPRCQGIVTRCPLILTLVHDYSKEFGVFTHAKNKKFNSFDEIKSEIIRQTSNLVGDNYQITRKPIKLTIYSPNVLNLTLIDLPCVTRVSMGDKQDDIEEMIRKMLLSYIEKENSIILAVTAANEDLSNSYVLMLARKVDPTGSRTIGVLTKVDIMNKGTNVRKELRGEGTFPLKLGYVAVLNRSQEDIDTNIDIKTAREKEMQFFSQNKHYKDITDKLGSVYLQKILNQVLSRKIYEKLPEIKQILEQQLFECEIQQNKFSANMIDYLKLNQMKDDEKLIYLREKRSIHLNEISKEFCKQIGRGEFDELEIDKISRGAEIHKIITEKHAERINEIRLDKSQIIKQLETGAVNYRGVYGGISLPDSAFQAVMTRHIEKFALPSEDCLRQVSCLLSETINECLEKLSTYPSLRDSVKNLTQKFVNEMTFRTQDRIKYIIEFQKTFICIEQNGYNTNLKSDSSIEKTNNSSTLKSVASSAAADDFPVLGKVAADKIIKPVIKSTINAWSSPDLESEETNFNYNLIERYAETLKRTFKEFIPRVIVHSFIGETRQFLKYKLESELDRNHDLLVMMERSREEEEKVQEFLNRKKAIEQALNEIKNL